MRLEIADNAPCPCDSKLSFAHCCQPFLSGTVAAPTAEALMRSRYTAFVLQQGDYLLATWHPAHRPQQLALEIADLLGFENLEGLWLGLNIKSTQDGQEQDQQGWVSFVARYKQQGRGHRLVERSHFVRDNGRWLYVDGEVA